MEIKEAVGILKSLQEPEAWEPQITEKTYDALDMAIRALKKFEDQNRFITVENNFQYCIKVDRVTGVMYAVSNGNDNAGTFTLLVNADGKPLIYEKRMTITESDLVKMGVIEPGEIKAEQVGPIDRQAALDIFDDYNVSVENGELEAYRRDRKRLCELPSVQPVATDTNVGNNSEIPNSSDAVSRQAALDCINGVEEVLRSLPSVQPERKKGEWLFNVRGCHGFTCPYCGTHKAFKHKFCPECGADLRGEKDG